MSPICWCPLSFSGGTKQSISIFMPLMYAILPSFLLCCSLAITLPLSLCFFLLTSSISWVPADFLILKGVAWKLQVVFLFHRLLQHSASLAVQSLSLSLFLYHCSWFLTRPISSRSTPYSSCKRRRDTSSSRLGDSSWQKGNQMEKDRRGYRLEQNCDFFSFGPRRRLSLQDTCLLCWMQLSK